MYVYAGHHNRQHEPSSQRHDAVRNRLITAVRVNMSNTMCECIYDCVLHIFTLCLWNF